MVEVMSDMTINIVRDFSRTPAGRYISDGPYSGERFREHFLIPALRSHRRITLELDGTRGMGSSFLEEAFGGLIRRGFSAADLVRRMILRTADPSLIAEIHGYWHP